MSIVRLARAAAVLCLCLPAMAQQLWFAQNDNASYGSYAAGWPASVIAFRFTAPSNASIAEAEVFTGNQTPAPHSVEIRTVDPVTGLPAALLGQPGTWTSTHARCWQGAVLATPANVSMGQDYYLVWHTGGMFPQHSLSDDNYPGNVLVETHISDGSSWHAQAMLNAKFRLFSVYPAGTVQAFGTGKPGQYGIPGIGITGWPAIASPLDVWLDNAARRQPALLLLGSPIPSGVPLPFATIYSSTAATILVTTELLSSPTSGGASLTLRVPNLAGLAGLQLALQWVVYDPMAADSLSHSSAVTATIQ